MFKKILPGCIFVAKQGAFSQKLEGQVPHLLWHPRRHLHVPPGPSRTSTLLEEMASTKNRLGRTNKRPLVDWNSFSVTGFRGCPSGAVGKLWSIGWGKRERERTGGLWRQWLSFFVSGLMWRRGKMFPWELVKKADGAESTYTDNSIILMRIGSG